MHLKSLLFATFCAIWVATEIKAQIKIGANSTTIEPSSNLEVEASTSGRKFKVDKTTGKITIADGTQDNGEVLITDANGTASWSKINVANIARLPKMIMNGAQTGALVDGVRVNLQYPNILDLDNGWYDFGQGVFAAYGGSYLIETYLTMENSEGCTGTSVMGLEMNVIRNGVVSTYPSLDERLAPVYHDKYITKVTQLTSIPPNTQVSFSILPTIKSPQAGCTTKVVEGYITMTYIP